MTQTHRIPAAPLVFGEEHLELKILTLVFIALHRETPYAARWRRFQRHRGQRAERRKQPKRHPQRSRTGCSPSNHEG